MSNREIVGILINYLGEDSIGCCKNIINLAAQVRSVRNFKMVNIWILTSLITNIVTIVVDVLQLDLFLEVIEIENLDSNEVDLQRGFKKIEGSKEKRL